MTPRILIIAGSDSGGGAGVQADIKTVTMLGGHAMTAITAITAQNTLGVQAIMPVPTEMVLGQIASCVSDIGVDAVKIGMLGSAATAHAVADVLEQLMDSPSLSGEGLGVTDASQRPPFDAPTPTQFRMNDAPHRSGHAGGMADPELLKGRGLKVPIVFDPVMVATSGDVLADAKTIAAFERLMRIATVTTPNLPELQALGGVEKVQAFGCAVLAKGGHDQSDVLTDRLIDSERELRWYSDRIVTTSTHGTGCTLASAIATFLAEGRSLKASVARARQFVRLAIHDAPDLGAGHGPMGHQRVRLDQGPEMRLNQITLPLGPDSATFYATLGLKQIVATDDGHYTRFEAPGGATLSVEREAQPTVFFECNDLDVEVARLQEAGMIFDQLPTEQSWLWREARLRDPAGNAVCLYQADENRRYPPWRLP